MKSRLLTPPISEECEPEFEVTAVDYARRKSDEIKQVNVPLETESIIAPQRQVDEVVKVPDAVSQVVPRNSGRLVVAGILLFCVCSFGILIWKTFLRDSAYGEVTGRLTDISAPWPGTISNIFIRPGSYVRQGEALAVVEDPELQASIERLKDDLRIAQAELRAKVALLAVAARERNNESAEIRANYFNLRGQLLAEKSRHEELGSKIKRRQALADRRAYSQEEIESLRFVKQGLANKIAELGKATEALEARLQEDLSELHDDAQTLPLKAKIESYQAEICRLQDQKHRGILRAPANCTVIEIDCQVGELATDSQSLVQLLPDDSIELVLYVKQNQVEDFQVGQSMEVVVESTDETIDCMVTRLGQRFEKPDSQIPSRYGNEEKLLPVYLTPTDDTPNAAQLKLGSTIRLPTSLLGYLR